MNSATITQDITPAERLAMIISAGVARYQASLPEYLRQGVDSEPTEACPNLAISADRQREICLNCPLADCVGVGNPQCPIRIEARRRWKRKEFPNVP
jgi:hypothetical protein